MLISEYRYQFVFQRGIVTQFTCFIVLDYLTQTFMLVFDDDFCTCGLKLRFYFCEFFFERTQKKNSLLGRLQEVLTFTLMLAISVFLLINVENHKMKLGEYLYLNTITLSNKNCQTSLTPALAKNQIRKC